MTILVGTCGWDYPHWRGVFYPEDLPRDAYLSYASRHLGSLEIDSSFYGLPESGTLRRWREETPDGFVFAFKASRYITHMKKLNDAGAALRSMLDRARLLEEKLGPIVFQLPPRWRVNVERLEGFLDLLPDDLAFAFEFRDRSWFCAEVYEALRAHGVGFCIYDLAGERTPWRRTSDLVYLRLHGPDGPYEGRYSRPALAGFAGAIHRWRHAGCDVCCYFDNDERGYAALNARELSDMVT